MANSKGAWIQRPQGAALELIGSMPAITPGAKASTRHLLEGAIAAAERAAPESSSSPFTTVTWALALVDQWYTAHHSVALLPLAIERYEDMNRADLARFAGRKLVEERGHDALPLADLRALGYDAGRVVQRVPAGKMAQALVAFGRETVAGPSPVSFFGYVFALERRVTRITGATLQALDRELGVQAASGVRAHATEFDCAHVEELVEFVAGLPADERTEIALASHATAAICAAQPDPAWDAERARLVATPGDANTNSATEGVTR